MIVGESLRRLPELVVGVAVEQHSVDGCGLLNEVETGLDAFIKHGMRAHLDPVESLRALCFRSRCQSREQGDGGKVRKSPTVGFGI